jgi:hypothetical protein
MSISREARDARNWGLVKCGAEFFAPVEMMTLAEVKAELRSYQPAAAENVIAAEEHLARRQQLWRLLDALLKAAAPERTRREI